MEGELSETLHLRWEKDILSPPILEAPRQCPLVLALGNEGVTIYDSVLLNSKFI
jgi:hypothetical protein